MTSIIKAVGTYITLNDAHVAYTRGVHHSQANKAHAHVTEFLLDIAMISTRKNCAMEFSLDSFCAGAIQSCKYTFTSDPLSRQFNIVILHL